MLKHCILNKPLWSLRERVSLHTCRKAPRIAEEAQELLVEFKKFRVTQIPGKKTPSLVACNGEQNS